MKPNHRPAAPKNRDKIIAQAWIEYFTKANSLLRPMRGLDRTLCVAIMVQLVGHTSDGGEGLTIEQILDVIGSYASPSTVRRYMRTFVARHLAVVVEKNKLLLYLATTALMDLNHDFLSLMGKTILNVLR